MNAVDTDAVGLKSPLAARSGATELEIPPVLQASVRRHEAHLARLLESFRAAGMDEAQIEAAVSVVIDSYKGELLQAILTLTAKPDTAEGSP
jgi:hypothetical protein